MANLPEDYAELVLKLRDALGLKALIETGSYGGLSAVWAADHFERVISIDILVQNQALAKERCAGKPNVEFIVDDSRAALADVLDALDQPAFIWLDAHFEAGQYGSDAADCPVLAELTAINVDPWHRHAILIDDAHYFLSPEYDRKVFPSMAEIEAVAAQGGYSVRRVGWGVAVLDPYVLQLLDGMPVHDRVPV